jgi:hypothetical protein
VDQALPDTPTLPSVVTPALVSDTLNKIRIRAGNNNRPRRIVNKFAKNIRRFRAKNTQSKGKDIRQFEEKEE